jgi:hypothetical protein
MFVPSAATFTNSSIPYSSPATYEDFAQRYPKYLRAYVRHGFVKVGTQPLTEEEYQRREASLENHLKLLSSQGLFVPSLPRVGMFFGYLRYLLQAHLLTIGGGAK